MNHVIYRLLRLNYRLRQWAAKQLTPSGFGLLGALFCSGLIGLDVRRSISYQIFALLFALLLVAIALSRLIRCRFSATRLLPRFGTVGVPLQYRVRVHNPSRKRWQGLKLMETFAGAFPSFQEFRRVKRRGEWLRLLSRRRWAFAEAVALPPLAAKGETEVTGQIVPLRRGLLTFKALTLACPEPLGFVNRCATLALPQSVLILPKRYRLPPLELPGGRRHQAGGLALAASVGDSEEFRALREYRPGDSPRKIHWKSWAKLGRPVIKEEQAEYSVRHALILDTFQLADDSEVLEEAVAIAASLACEIQTQESLLDMVFVGPEAHRFTVGLGLGHTERLLELLASVLPCQDKSFDSLLPVVQGRLSLLSGCICIFLDWDDDRQTLVEQLQAAGVPVLILVIEGERGLSQVPDRRCLSDRQSRLHVLHLGNIQAGLSAL